MRSPDLRTAPSWRPVRPGRRAVEADRGALADLGLVARKPGEPIAPNSFTACARSTASRSRGGRDRKSARTPSAGWPFQRLPVVDMIEVSESTQLRVCTASVWAIIPPIDAPTTCAGPRSSSSQQAGGVVGHVGERVLLGGGSGARPAAASPGGWHVDRGRAPDVAVVEADDVEAAPGELVAEVVGPADQLHAEAHDEEQRRVVRVAESSRSRG